jgi:hypothetical protein
MTSGGEAQRGGRTDGFSDQHGLLGLELLEKARHRLETMQRSRTPFTATQRTGISGSQGTDVGGAGALRRASIR